MESHKIHVPKWWHSQCMESLIKFHGSSHHQPDLQRGHQESFLWFTQVTFPAPELLNLIEIEVDLTADHPKDSSNLFEGTMFTTLKMGDNNGFSKDHCWNYPFHHYHHHGHDVFSWFIKLVPYFCSCVFFHCVHHCPIMIVIYCPWLSNNYHNPSLSMKWKIHWIRILDSY